MSEPLLNHNDRLSGVWQKLKPYLEIQLEILRAKNDKPMPEEITARLRGRIAAVRDLLSLGTDKPKHVSEDDAFED